MQSEIDLLRQHFTELEAKYTKIKAEKAELEARNAELIKQMMEENNRRDAENAELRKITLKIMLSLEIESRKWNRISH